MELTFQIQNNTGFTMIFIHFSVHNFSTGKNYVPPLLYSYPFLNNISNFELFIRVIRVRIHFYSIQVIILVFYIRKCIKLIVNYVLNTIYI